MPAPIASEPPAASTIIRAARINEAALLTQLAQASKAHWPYPAAALDGWRGALTIAPHLIAAGRAFVCEREAGVAGFTILSPDAGGDRTLWLLRDLWVRPQDIGQGIGSRLLEHACAFAAQHGVATLAIDADPYAEAFYRARGAQRVGAVAAPITGEPDRVRPQLRLPTAPRRAPLSL